MKTAIFIVLLSLALLPSFAAAETYEGITCTNQQLDTVVLKNSRAINCTFTNSKIVSSVIADSVMEKSTIESSSVSNSRIISSTIISSSVTQSTIEKSSVQGGSALFFDHIYDTTINGGIIRDSYGERTEIHAVDVQRSEFRSSKIFNAYLKDSTVAESYLDGFTAEDATLKGVVINRAMLVETFIEDGWLDRVRAERATFMNANIGNAELYDVVLCKTGHRDEGTYYGDCETTNEENSNPRIPFVGMSLVYETAGHETIRHNFTHMIDENTISVLTLEPFSYDGYTVAGYASYEQHININSRKIEYVSNETMAQRGYAGENLEGAYTDLWIPLTTETGDSLLVGNYRVLVGRETDRIWYVGNQTNETTFGARVYDKKTGLFLQFNTPTPTQQLGHTNAPISERAW